MTRALVLGGGGPVGIGWEAGLLVGLKRAGVDTGSSDAVIGTSAGSVVGFVLASGADLTEATALIESANAEPADAASSESGAVAAAQGLEQLISAVAEAASQPEAAESIRARLGQLALEAETVSEQRWLQMFDFLAGAEWPERFACTAVDVATGRFKVWRSDDGVDPQHAVASSCAVPCIFPPVTIGSARWMDGGVRDMLNVDAAAGHQTVLAVSCTLLELPPGFSTPAMDAVFGATRAQLDGLRDGGSKVEAIVPGAEMLEISGWGLELMDFTRARAAYEAGVRQGEEESARLAGFWAS
jgi:NTE family protein